MSSLRGKKIILGVCGSIAAYKAAYLVRLLTGEGCSVRVIMTTSASDFVSPLTFSTLSKYPVASDIHNGEAWTNHVEWALWADAMVIAPATAHTIARCSYGLSSDMLTATYLSARCPVFLAPAMDLDMWQHPSTVENISRLQAFGNFIIDVSTGELASGLIGPGRMAEPQEIITRLTEFFHFKEDMTGLKVLINAGPTYEAIDPVRYVGNHSTGKMGVAIAEEFASRGSDVTLILGPDSVLPADDRIRIERITSADEMLAACESSFPSSDITVLAAAVADYKPAVAAKEKIKKEADRMTLELVRTPDIAASLGSKKRDHQILVGFALETTNGEANASEKMHKKNMDMIVLNNPKDTGAAFGHDTNKVTFLFPDNKRQSFELKSKKDVARDIVDAIYQIKNANGKN
ncbi:MAG TPA: bifunctional phosphopantothenoylcysteine decarboxylase/phosphopantothenate--cysteine ligase CoaBC [Saprospiraceae bacterium]|nr:bifunctional phosphopantothenoylcysteine decarboxylase/phosphopantothenate--cysteine ligase CoaBC [Saprospiraceae bacterium]